MVKYSSTSILPPLTFSVLVVGTLAVIRVIDEVSPLLMWMVAVVIR